MLAILSLLGTEDKTPALALGAVQRTFTVINIMYILAPDFLQTQIHSPKSYDPAEEISVDINEALF